MTETAIRLLGPVEASVDGEAVALVRSQPRQILALLGARNGGDITTDEIIEELWPLTKPRAPRRAVQVAISRLRSTLRDADGTVVLGTPAGYRLANCANDIDEFMAAVQAGENTEDPLAAIETLEHALSLWRGLPFADAQGPPALSDAAHALRSTQLRCTIALANHLVGQGRCARAISLTRAEFDEAPENEALARVLAAAMAAEGRKAEALSVLHRLQTALRDQFGVEPSATTRDLEHDILYLSVALPEPQRLLTNAPVQFVGRETELEQLELTAATQRVAVVVAEAGMGKSALLGELISRLPSSTHRPLSVTVEPDPQRPLAPIVEIVQTLIDLHAAAPNSDAQIAAVKRIIPELPGDHVAAAGVTRDELISGLGQFIATQAGARDIVLIIDDIHLLENLSAAVLTEAGRKQACALVLAGRPSPPEHVEALMRLGSTVALASLDRQAVATYLEARYRRPQQPGRLDDLLEMSGGNPLFLSLLVDLDLEGQLNQNELPTTILIAVKSRLDMLSDRCIDTLQYAAALGGRFPLAPLRQLRTRVDADLDDAADAGLVVREQTNDSARFVHRLVAEATHQMMGQGRRIEVHDQVGGILEAAGASAVEYAPHYTIAAEVDPMRAAQAHFKAGLSFAEAHSLDIARDHFSACRDVLLRYQLDQTNLATEALVWLGRVQRLEGDPGHVQPLLEAVETARAGKHIEWFGLAVAELCRHGATTQTGVDHATTELIEEALTYPLSPKLRAELLASVSTFTALGEDYRRGQRYFHQALAIAEASGDATCEANVLAHAHLGLGHPDDFDRRLDAAQRLSEVAGNQPDLHWEVAYLRFWDAFLWADPPRMAEAIATMRALTPSARHRQVSLLHIETTYAHVLGDLALAEANLARARTAAVDSLSDSWGNAHQSVLLFTIRWSQGRLQELAGRAEISASHLPGFPNWRSAGAIILAEAGRGVEARSEIDALCQDNFGLVFQDITWTATLTTLAHASCTIDYHTHADQLFNALAPHTGKLSWAGSCTMGPVDEALARLADLLGHGDQASIYRARADAVTARLASARPSLS